MIENKRFKLGYVCGDYGLIDNDEWIDLYSMSENSEKNVQICINKMNELAEENQQLEKSKMEIANDLGKIIDENEQLKSELQNIYEIATANKIIDILETIYDDLLYETSDKSNFERKMVLKCIEKIDNFRDDLE